MTKEQLENLDIMIDFFNDWQCLVGMTTMQARSVANGFTEALNSLKCEDQEQVVEDIQPIQ